MKMKVLNPNNKNFYEITNKEIYCKLIEIETQVRTTNGKVKLNRWIATTALSIGCLMIGFALSTLQ